MEYGKGGVKMDGRMVWKTSARMVVVGFLAFLTFRFGGKGQRFSNKLDFQNEPNPVWQYAQTNREMISCFFWRNTYYCCVDESNHIFCECLSFRFYFVEACPNLESLFLSLSIYMYIYIYIYIFKQKGTYYKGNITNFYIFVIEHKKWFLMISGCF